MKKSDKLFKTLGIDRTSDKSKIKKAYKNKAKNMHPDAGGNEDDFKELNFAYSIVISQEKIQRFDSGMDYKDKNSELYTTLCTLFQLGIDNNPDNILEFIRIHLIEKIDGLKKNIEKIKNEKIKYEKLKGKVFNTKNNDNMFDNLILQRIEECNHSLNMLNGKMKLLNSVKSELNEYSEKDVPEELSFEDDFLFRPNSYFFVKS